MNGLIRFTYGKRDMNIGTLYVDASAIEKIESDPLSAGKESLISLHSGYQAFVIGNMDDIAKQVTKARYTKIPTIYSFKSQGKEDPS